MSAHLVPGFPLWRDRGQGEGADESEGLGDWWLRDSENGPFPNGILSKNEFIRRARAAGNFWQELNSDKVNGSAGCGDRQMPYSTLTARAAAAGVSRLQSIPTCDNASEIDWNNDDDIDLDAVLGASESAPVNESPEMRIFHPNSDKVNGSAGCGDRQMPYSTLTAEEARNGAAAAGVNRLQSILPCDNASEIDWNSDDGIDWDTVLGASESAPVNEYQEMRIFHPKLPRPGYLLGALSHDSNLDKLKSLPVEAKSGPFLYTFSTFDGDEIAVVLPTFDRKKFKTKRAINDTISRFSTNNFSTDDLCHVIRISKKMLNADGFDVEEFRTDYHIDLSVMQNVLSRFKRQEHYASLYEGLGRLVPINMQDLV